MLEELEQIKLIIEAGGNAKSMFYAWIAYKIFVDASIWTLLFFGGRAFYLLVKKGMED